MSADPITVCITPTIQRHYEARGINADLLAALDERRFVGVGRERAAELLQDAEQQRQRRDIPKGTPKSLTSLAQQVRRALEMPSPARQPARKRKGPAASAEDRLRAEWQRDRERAVRAVSFEAALAEAQERARRRREAVPTIQAWQVEAAKHDRALQAMLWSLVQQAQQGGPQAQ